MHRKEKIKPMKKKMSSLGISIFSAMLITFIFLSNADASADAFIKGALICAKNVVPSLFPLMIASDLIGKASAKKSSALLLLSMGWTFGFPICAIGGSRLLKEKRINDDVYDILICVGGIPSIGFFLGFCRDTFGTKQAIALYLTAVASAAICGSVLYCGKGVKKRHIQARTDENNSISVIETVSESMKSSSIRCLNVVACVAFFYMLSARITENISNNTLKAIVFGILEFSGGCSICAGLGKKTGYVICSAILSFSGISAYIQIASAQRSYGILPSPKKYFSAKAFQSALSITLSVAAVCGSVKTRAVIFAAIIFFIVLFYLSQRINKKILNKA